MPRQAHQPRALPLATLFDGARSEEETQVDIGMFVIHKPLLPVSAAHIAPKRPFLVTEPLVLAQHLGTGALSLPPLG